MRAPEISTPLVGGLIVVFLLLLALRAPAQTGADWGIDNPRVPWGQGSEGLAADGACYGMVRAKLEFQRLGLEKTVGHSFTDLTTPAKDPLTHQELPGQRMFIEQFAAMAQNYTLRKRDFETEVYRKTADPLEVDRSLLAHGVGEDHQQILILSNKLAYDHDRNDNTIPPENKTPRVAHTVIVEHRVIGETIHYLVSDPNGPRDASGARVLREIVYDKTTHTFTGLGHYDAIQHDTTELPEQNRRWLDALLKGAVQPENSRYLPTWRGEHDMPLKDEDYLRQRQSGKKLPIIEPPLPSDGLQKRVSVVRPDEVGGVRLYFDPALVTDARNTQDRWNIIGELTTQLTAGRENFLVQVGGQDDVEAVRLSAILRDAGDAPEATLGDLTRLTGFVLNRTTGEVFLLGRHEADRNAIPLAMLTVALQAIWKQQQTPAISLDADPDDFSGPQRVRIEGMPAAYRNSPFIQTMLEADYTMKRILLAEDTPDIAGLHSYAELLGSSPLAEQTEYSRWWLCPRETPGADVYETTAGELTACYFTADICVKTEEMKRARDDLTGTGTRDDLAEAAARSFTDNYAQIEEQRPIFQQLHALFEVAKLAAVLKARGIANAQFDAVAARAVPAVEIKDSYDGIGPKAIPHTEGEQTTFLYLSGGVQLNADLAPADFIDAQHLFPAEMPDTLRQDDDQLTLALQIPATLPLDPKAARRVDGELETNAALQELLHGDRQLAFARINRLLAAGQTVGGRAFAVRAMALMIAGNYPAALQDADAAVAIAPNWRGLRGRIHLLAGDRRQAIDDVQAASAANPDNSGILFQKVWVLVHAGHWADVDEALARLNVLNPGERDVESMRQELRLLRHLDKPAADAYVHAILSIPLTLSFDLTRAEELMTQGKDAEARDALQQLLTQPALQPRSAPDPALLLEHCWISCATLAAKLGTPEDMARAHGYLDRLHFRHPAWPSALLLHLAIDQQLPLQASLQLYDRACALPATNDTIMLELAVQYGVDLRTQQGYLLAMRACAELNTDRTLQIATVRALITRVLARMPEGMAKHALLLTKKSLYFTEVKRGVKPLDAAEDKRMNAEIDEEFLTPPPLPPTPSRIDLFAYANIFLPFLAEDCAHARTPEELVKVDRLFTLNITTLNRDWTTVDDLETAAQQQVLAYAYYTPQLQVRLSQLPAVSAAVEALKEEDADQEQAITALDQATTTLLDTLDGVSPYEKAQLHANLFAVYPEILQQAENADLINLTARHEQQFAQQLCTTPTSLVEQRAVSLWFENSITALPARNIDADLQAQMTREYHRSASRLKQQFLTQAASQ